MERTRAAAGTRTELTVQEPARQPSSTRAPRRQHVVLRLLQGRPPRADFSMQPEFVPVLARCLRPGLKPQVVGARRFPAIAPARAARPESRAREAWGRLRCPATSGSSPARTSSGPPSRVVGRSVGRLRADRPLISPSGGLEGEVPGAARGDDQPAAGVGGIRLGMARRTERHQQVEIEIRASLGALDDVVNLEGAPAATGLAPPTGAPERHPSDRCR